MPARLPRRRRPLADRWGDSVRWLRRRRTRRTLLTAARILGAGAAVAALTVALIMIGRLNGGPSIGTAPAAVGDEKTSATPTASPRPDGPADPLAAGVPAGVELTPAHRDVVIEHDGTVIDGYDVHGRIIVKADDVTIRNTIVRGADSGSINGLIDATRGHTGLLIEDSEIFAAVESNSVNGIIGSHFTLRRVDIHHVVDQVQVIGPNVLIEDSWFHDNLHWDSDPNQGGEPTHDDSIEVFGGSDIVVRHNHLTGAYNANLQLSQVRDRITDLVFEDNVATGWAGCNINIAEFGRGPLEGVIIQRNTFGPETRLRDCTVISPQTTQPLLIDNVLTDGRPIPPVRKG